MDTRKTIKELMKMAKDIVEQQDKLTQQYLAILSAISALEKAETENNLLR